MTEIDAYDYELPRELIAQHPLKCRSDARLMVVDRSEEQTVHSHVRDLADHLVPGDCLVLNDTRVVPARLVGSRADTGGRWTGLFLSSDSQGLWEILGKTRGKLRPGDRILLQDRRAEAAFGLSLVTPLDGGRWAARPEASGHWSELLDEVGRVPLPPYIRGGEMEDADRGAYQTVFARHPGAVAAPTAGLHFTEPLLEDLRRRGIDIVQTTLHVGLGTFRPVSVDRLEDHAMHGEWGRIDASAVERLNACRRRGGRVIAVGTTVVRVLETAASDGSLKEWEGTTHLFIRPGFCFQAIDGLLTNFHLPKSTLLVLVRAFGGEQRMAGAYASAIAERYRFYSYGDAMLIV